MRRGFINMNRLNRIIQYFMKCFYVIIMSIFVPSFFRVRILRMLGASIGSGVVMEDGINLRSNNITIEKDVFINCSCWLDTNARITIGEGVRFAPFVKVVTRTHSIQPSVIRRLPGDDIDLPVFIGRGCWIGTGVTILPGVVIAEGCVIAAGAIVTESTEPNGLYAGAPAKRKKSLPISTEL